jgi:uncharacterized protein YfaT (DUF1175 family)
MSPRLTHPGARDAFRRRFADIAVSQFAGPPATEITDCAALLRFAYRLAVRGLGVSPLFATPDGPRHFADAKTLRHFNTVFVSRRIEAALSADLLFYLQPDQDQPFHAMICLDSEASLVSAGRAVVYHTGGKKGEIRLVTLSDLHGHPDPRWRPDAGNPTFLGVHRWKILA